MRVIGRPWELLRAALLLIISLLVLGACGPPSPPREPATPVVVGAEPTSPTMAMAASTEGAEGKADWFPAAHAEAKVPVFDDDPTWGDALAPVTLVLFSDFQCPYCGRFAATLQELQRVYGEGALRIVWKDYPLPFHKEAPAAHAAARAVYELGGDDAFWAMHDRLFDNQRSWSPANVSSWAAESGVSPAKLERHLASPAVERQIDDNLALGKQVGVRGTPAMFINGAFVSGARPLSDFEELIDAELAAVTKLAARGVEKRDVYVARTERNFAEKPAPKPSPSPRADTTTVWKIPVHKDDPSQGHPGALVTIVAFSEFQCPFCKRAKPTLDKLLADYGKDLRLVWKDNPLPFHKRAEPAAIVAREVYAQKGDKGFWTIHDLLFANQKDLGDAELIDYAKQAGANAWRVKNALDKSLHTKVIARSQEEATDFDATGTPHFFINGRRLVGAQPAEEFRAIIDEEIARAKALLATGTPRSKLYEKLVEKGKSPPPPEKKTVGPPPKDAPFKGPKNAKVVIQMFSDFQCPFCKRADATLDEVMKKHGRRVKLVFRHKPLPMHKDAALAHEAAVEAYVQKGDKGFWAMYEKLFANQQHLDRQDLERYGAEIGLDVGKLATALDSRRHQQRVEADVDASDKAGIRGTPGFVINDYFLSGAQPEAKFDRLIKRAYADAP